MRRRRIGSLGRPGMTRLRSGCGSSSRRAGGTESGRPIQKHSLFHPLSSLVVPPSFNRPYVDLAHTFFFSYALTSLFLAFEVAFGKFTLPPQLFYYILYLSSSSLSLSLSSLSLSLSLFLLFSFSVPLSFHFLTFSSSKFKYSFLSLHFPFLQLPSTHILSNTHQCQFRSRNLGFPSSPPRLPNPKTNHSSKVRAECVSNCNHRSPFLFRLRPLPPSPSLPSPSSLFRPSALQPSTSS